MFFTLVCYICPGAEFHGASLLVKREILDIDSTGGFVDSWRLPLHQTRVMYGGLSGQGHLEITVSTAIKNM